MLLAGRRINDRMGVYAASKLVREMIRQDIKIKGSRVLVMGLTFKENCPDLRNTRVVDIIAELKGNGVRVDVHDPWADAAQAQKEYGLDLVENPQSRRYDGLILAVAHTAFHMMGAEKIKTFGITALSPLLDIKGILPKSEGIFRL
jgi:UDP-N-acetyl-D-galactosamine dehydrogenase